MKIRCIAIDDEPLALEVISEHIEQLSDLELLGTFHNPMVAKTFLEKNPVDVVFLDIDMPDISGLDFSRQLPKQTKIIFTTAHKRYAIESYEVEALGYLLKPFSAEELDKSLERLRSYLLEIRGSDEDNHIYVKSEYKKVRLAFDDILFVENIKDYVRFHLSNGEKIMSLMSLKSLVEVLPEKDFLQVHRSFVINLTKVEELRKNEIRIRNKSVPVSRKYKDQLSEVLDHLIK